MEDLLNGRDPSPRRSPRRESSSNALARLNNCKAKMSLLARCQWSLSGKARIRGLISDLREYNDDLIRLCTWEAQSQINRGLPAVTLSHLNNYVALFFVANAAEDAANEQRTSPSSEGRQMVADMARFKARLKTPNSVSDKFRKSRNSLDIRDFQFSRNGQNDYSWTTAVRTYDRTMVFVEWRSYSSDSVLLNNLTLAHDNDRRSLQLLAEQQIDKLGNFLCTRDRPYKLRTLVCIGLFKDELNQRYGVVYHIPQYLEELPSRFIQADLSERFPSTLTVLFHRITHVLDLGLRFDLARKLMEALMSLHAVGWLHKDLRSDNILFFPVKPSYTHGRIDGSKKDFGHPYIMGYGLSRPDDVDHGPRETSSARVSPHDVSIVRTIPAIVPRSRSHSPLPPPKQVDIYQHPNKWTNPSNRYRHGYDIYSLGVILLEIGLWKSLKSLRLGPGYNAEDYRSHILTNLVPTLNGQCGSIYAGVVKECLTMPCEVADMERQSQRKLCWDLAERLDKCIA